MIASHAGYVKISNYIKIIRHIDRGRVTEKKKTIYLLV